MANQQKDEKQAQQLIAQGDTMTAYGVTVDGIIEAAKADSDRQAGEITKLEAVIQGLMKADAAKAETIKDLGVDLAVAKVVAQDAKQVAGALQRLPSGGLRIMVTLDQDAAVPLLSQAEQAGEDPSKYIATALNEALLAYTSS